MEPDNAEHQRLHCESFKAFLAAVPDLADLDIDRSPEPARIIAFPDPPDEDPVP